MQALEPALYFGSSSAQAAKPDWNCHLESHLLQADMTKCCSFGRATCCLLLMVLCALPVSYARELHGAIKRLTLLLAVSMNHGSAQKV